MAGELVDDVLRQIGAAHVGDRRRVDHVAGRAAEQTAQESQARFPRPGAERGEPVGADVGGETALAGMARAGVVDGDEGRAGKPRPQHRFVLGAEISSLAVKSRTTWRLEITRPRPVRSATIRLAGHLALKMQHQHQTMQMRAAAADNPRRQRRNQRLAVRRLPALAPIARRLGLQHQVLNDDLLDSPCGASPPGRRPKAFPSRSIESLETPGPRRRFAASSCRAWAPPLRPIRRLLHPGRLLRRTRRQMLQPRDLVLQRLVLNPQPRQGRAHLLVLRPQPLHFANQLANQADQLGRRHAFKRINRARRHARLESSLL